jgi:rhamnosyltransferase
LDRAEHQSANANQVPVGQKIALIIPTHNGLRYWHALLEGIRTQSLQPQQVIIVDSASTDGTAREARNAGFTVLEIDNKDFDHGGTRQFAVEQAPDADILLFLTQDAIPSDTDTFKQLVSAFQDLSIGAAYGRQVPRAIATPIEAHARKFNYPPTSAVRSWETRSNLGFKSIFFSNSFGAYRREALMSVGGFSSDVIFGEDTLVVGRLHRAGWKTAYVADALVQHSHSYSIQQEFRRYFDIGVLHAREGWLLEHFGSATGEGQRFVLSELSYLLKHAPFLIPSALIRTITKFLGYKVGRQEHKMGSRLKYHLGLNKAFWTR